MSGDVSFTSQFIILKQKALTNDKAYYEFLKLARSLNKNDIDAVIKQFPTYQHLDAFYMHVLKSQLKYPYLCHHQNNNNNGTIICFQPAILALYKNYGIRIGASIACYQLFHLQFNQINFLSKNDEENLIKWIQKINSFDDKNISIDEMKNKLFGCEKIDDIELVSITNTIKITLNDLLCTKFCPGFIWLGLNH